MANDGLGFDPEDFLRVAREVRNRLRGSHRYLILVAAAVLALVTVASSYYQVEPARSPW